jgi:4-hydroxy-tetrahydrodipicolinate reductase
MSVASTYRLNCIPKVTRSTDLLDHGNGRPRIPRKAAASTYGDCVINVCFAGITGWTAPPIVAAVDRSDDLRLTAGVSRSAAGRTLADAVGSRSNGLVYASVTEALQSAPVDVLVDYTSATAVKNNVWTAVRAGVNVVIGSSGLTAADYEELNRLARDHSAGVIAAGNFSIMAAVLRRAAAMAADHLDSWEIIDYASDTKPDVPSGTSRELAETLGAIRTPKLAVALRDLHGPVEARGAEVAGSRIHSVRLPSFVVTTEIVFSGPGERLVMRHDPGTDPDPYVAGTLLAVRGVTETVGVRRGLDSLLFGDQSKG